MIKSECTPEQWERRLASMRERRVKDPEAVRAYQREYSHRPEAKAKRQAGNKTEEARAKDRERYQRRKAEGKITKTERTPEEKAARKKEAWLAYNTPERAAARAERIRLREEAEPAHRAARLAYLQQYARKKNTNFTEENYAEAMRIQGGKCAICGSDYRLHCDHDHATGSPRGILCHKCNVTEGFIFSSGLSPEEFGKKLQDYINSPTLKPK